MIDTDGEKPGWFPFSGATLLPLCQGRMGRIRTGALVRRLFGDMTKYTLMATSKNHSFRRVDV